MQSYTPLPREENHRLFTHEKGFYRMFFSLLAVITLQQLAALAVNLVDNVMLGRYTELALSGATLVNQIQFTLQQIAGGIGMGVAVLGSQYWGQQNIRPIKQITSVGMKFAILAGLIFMLASKLFPHAVLSIFTDDEAVIAEGSKYLAVMCWTYLIFAVSNTLMYSLRAVETAFIGMVMSISTIIINGCLNFLFIYGNFGCPELGIVGAGIATLTSRIVELVIILIYCLFRDKKLHLSPGDIFGFDFTYIRDYLKAGAPVMISGALWGVAQGAQTAILGHINATVIAASSIASVIFQIFAVVGTSSANASSVVIGKTIGEKRLELIRPYSRSMQLIFLIIGVVSAAAMFFTRDLIVSFYSVSPEAKQLAADFLIVLSAFTIGSCYQYPAGGGIMLGGGSTKYQAVVDMLFMWLLVIPASAISAFVLDLSPIVTFAVLKSDQVLKCIPTAIICNRYHWVKVLTR